MQPRRWTTPVSFLVAVLVTTATPQDVITQDADPAIFRLLTFDTGGDMRLGATTGRGTSDIVDVHNGIRWLIQVAAPEVLTLPYVPADMRTLIEAGPRSTAAVRQVYQAVVARRTAGTFREPGGAERVFHPATAVRILTPVTNPSKIYGLAGNYPREGELANPKLPSAFFKSPASLAGPDDVIDLAGLVNKGVHEPEMSLVIGRRAKNVSEGQALEYVYGYTICNDVSARDLVQGTHTTQGATFSKGLDTFSPCGPFLTLKQDVPDPHNLGIEARVNGKVWPLPNANTRHLTFKIPQIIAYISRRMTLLPGDIIQTGVPAPVVELKAGDTIEISVERLGTLRNRVVANGSDGSSSGLAVWSAGAIEPALLQLAEQYTRVTGTEVDIQFGTAPELAARLKSGDLPEVLIAPPAVISQVSGIGAALADTQVSIARVGVGVTVREGAAVPDVTTVDALKRALLEADSVVYNQASTGLYLDELFRRVGIHAQLQAKTTRYATAAQVLEHVIAGKGNEIGLGPITEIRAYEPKGLVLVAPLPGDVQNYTTYIAVVMAAAREGIAKDFVRHLTTAEARLTFAAAGQ